jgi:hypothetical protein
MKPDFRPDLMTKNIAYCLLEQCPQANSCLRYLSYLHSSPFSTHSFVDPRNAVSKGCPHYLTNRVQHQARGFKRAIGLLPYNSVASFRGRITYELNCGRSHFYRYSSGEYPLSEARQAIVRAVFQEFGIEQEELFDSYEEAYELSY